MELAVRKSDLLKELSLLQGIVERKNTIPILANVLFNATKDHVSLLATDLDVHRSTRVIGQASLARRACFWNFQGVTVSATLAQRVRFEIAKRQSARGRLHRQDAVGFLEVFVADALGDGQDFVEAPLGRGHS